MKIQLIVILALSLCVTSRDSNDEDEGRPYEFGFTIDGQQHRRESKDVNGIIMGEFGFITADGIYHVTVYATDENGSFKILSMRNVRVSGPLDQPGYEFPSKTAVQQPQAPTTTTTTTTVAPTTNNAPYIFTTLPSLKVPSCSSCRLPSTTPRPPGASNKLQFQTPEFQENKPGILNKGPQRQNAPFSTPNNKQPVVPQNLAPHNNLGISSEGPPIVAPQNNVGPPNVGLQNNVGPANVGPQNNVGPPNVAPQSNVGPPNVAQQNNVRPSNFAPQNNISPQNNVPFSNQNAPENSRKNVEEDLDKFGVGVFEPRFEPKPVKPSIEQQPPFQNPGNNAIDLTNQNPISPTHESLQNPPPNIAARIPDQFPNPTNQNFPPKSPEITVANHQINIPGKEPIPIKDSYPNMIDGLPNGITENDMLDLLYKFNYTLGFHGHHERGLKNGAKIGAYFVNGRDGIMRVVEYIADENGYRPKVKFINLGLDSPDTPKEGTEKTFGLKGFEFVWYPV